MNYEFWMMNRNRAVVAQTCFGGLRFFPNRQQKAADLQNRSARKRKHVAQGSQFSLAAFPPRRGFGGAAHENLDYLFAARQNPRRWKCRRAGVRALRYALRSRNKRSNDFWYWS